jgi:hypothetical protein
MKAAGIRLWAVAAEARYVRALSSVCSSASADAISQKTQWVLLRQKSGKKLHLATAYSLQPTAWWFAQ